MTTSLLPQTFWFRLAVPCRRIDGLPRSASNGKGALLDLPESCALPELTRLDGKTPWAQVRVAWNPQGLAVAIESHGPTGPTPLDDRPDGWHDAQLWIDTRDTRTINRASRFCHRFTARLTPVGRVALGVEVAARPIARAMADAPLASASLLATSARAERLKNGWRLEWFLPAAALSGFDPETSRRLGFAYQVIDPNQEDQFLGVGREFPIGENPSLWATLDLQESP